MIREIMVMPLTTAVERNRRLIACGGSLNRKPRSVLESFPANCCRVYREGAKKGQVKSVAPRRPPRTRRKARSDCLPRSTAVRRKRGSRESFASNCCRVYHEGAKKGQVKSVAPRRPPRTRRKARSDCSPRSWRPGRGRRAVAQETGARETSRSASQEDAKVRRMDDGSRPGPMAHASPVPARLLGTSSRVLAAKRTNRPAG